MPNLIVANVKTYEVDDPWPKYSYRATCGDCRQVVGESRKSLAAAVEAAQSHQCQ